MALNLVVSDFVAARAGLTTNVADTIAGCRAMLVSLLRDADAQALTRAGSYTGPFQRLCREVHLELAAAAPAADAVHSG